MTRRAKLRRSLVLIPLVAATLAACTTAAPQRMVGTNDVVFDRQRIMKVQGAMWTDAQNKFKAGNIEAMASNAEVIAINAKPELWQRRSEFEAAAKNLTVWSERLRDASKSKDEKAVADIMKDYGRVA